jgi:TPR repeat protein
MAVEGVADAPVRLHKDLVRGRRALEHGCQLGSLAACAELRAYDYDASLSGPLRACDGWLALCDRGDLRSCAFGAGCLLHEDGFPKDVERAMALLGAACAKGEKVGCRNLAFELESGTYIEADAARAFGLMKKACQLDDPDACAHLGRYHERGVGTSVDVGVARGLYRASCARGIKGLPCQALERLGEVPPAVQER